MVGGMKMAEEMKELQQTEDNATILDGSESAGVAGNTADEAKAPSAHDDIIAQQQSTIDTLLKRTEELTRELNTLISMGAQINDGSATEITKAIETQAKDDDYISLADLGKFIGNKKEVI